jgi:hypothetical protein
MKGTKENSRDRGKCEEQRKTCGTMENVWDSGKFQGQRISEGLIWGNKT